MVQYSTTDTEIMGLNPVALNLLTCQRNNGDETLMLSISNSSVVKQSTTDSEIEGLKPTFAQYNNKNER
jgi:hypothetical protein